jgi:hypothetical protein
MLSRSAWRFAPFVSNDLAREAARDLDGPEARDLLRRRDAAADLFISLGIDASQQSALVQALHLTIASPLTAPLIEPADAPAGSVQRASNYLELAATLRVDALYRHEYPAGERPRPLLFAMARLAMLEQVDARARELLVASGADPSRWDDDDLPSQFNDYYASMQRRLESPDPLDPLAPIAFHLSEAGRDAYALATLRGILRDLKTRPPDLLDEIFRASLCLFSARLDAWYTALASEELAVLRQDPATMTGVNVGAYGVLENIRQSPRRSAQGMPVELKGYPIQKNRHLLRIT